MIGPLIVLYNLVLVAGTAYLVAMHNWSGWWFLLTALFLMQYKNDKS
jgi:hypothetical protein